MHFQILLGSINLYAVFLAAASAFLLGSIWYSPRVFGSIWLQASGKSKEASDKQHSMTVYGWAFLLALIAAFAFALFLGGQPDLISAICMGFVIGICWVVTSFGINYLFAGKDYRLFLIDSGYHVVQFVLYGFILGLWH